MAPERFRPGDALVIPVLIVAGKTIVNISDGTLTGALWSYRTKLATLTVGNGIQILNFAPPAATANQSPHALVTIPSALTAQLPLGAVSKITLDFVNSAGVRMAAECVPLEGVTCSEAGSC